MTPSELYYYYYYNTTHTRARSLCLARTCHPPSCPASQPAWAAILSSSRATRLHSLLHVAPRSTAPYRYPRPARAPPYSSSQPRSGARLLPVLQTPVTGPPLRPPTTRLPTPRVLLFDGTYDTTSGRCSGHYTAFSLSVSPLQQRPASPASMASVPHRRHCPPTIRTPPPPSRHLLCSTNDRASPPTPHSSPRCL